MTFDRSRWLTYLMVILLSVVSLVPLWMAYRHHQYLNDDTYITLNYAKNLANGKGFVFNHPPPTLGTTTPLFTLIIAGLSLLCPFLGTQTLAAYFTAFCWLGAGWVIFLFRKNWGILEWQAGIIGITLIFSCNWIAFLGMEAYLFAFLLVLSLSLFHCQAYFLAGVCTGLLFLTRGEGILILFILGFFSLLERWSEHREFNFALIKPSLDLVIGFALPTLLWSGYAYFTFGNLLPNTLSAKMAQGQTSLMHRPFLRRIIQEWLPTWGQHFRIAQIPFLNVWWLLIGVGVVMALVRMRNWLAFLMWIVSYVVGYTLLGVSAYWWYQLPIVFVLVLFFALGFVESIRLFLEKLDYRFLSVGISVLACVIVIYFSGWPTLVAALAYEGDSRAASYLQLSRWFQTHTEPQESVAFIEIGYLGYYTDNRIIDLAGLVVPDIVPHVAEGDFSWGFWHYQPDYYVYLPDFDWALGDILLDPRFERCYRAVANLPGPRETDFTIYKRMGCDE